MNLIARSWSLHDSTMVSVDQDVDLSCSLYTIMHNLVSEWNNTVKIKET